MLEFGIDWQPVSHAAWHMRRQGQRGSSDRPLTSSRWVTLHCPLAGTAPPR